MTSSKVPFGGCRFLALPFVFWVVNDGAGRSMMMSAGEFTTCPSGLVSTRSRHAEQKVQRRTLIGYPAAVVARLRNLAPYVAILVLPGGSLMALLLWLYRRQRKAPSLPTR